MNTDKKANKKSFVSIIYNKEANKDKFGLYNKPWDIFPTRHISPGVVDNKYNIGISEEAFKIIQEKFPAIFMGFDSSLEYDVNIEESYWNTSHIVIKLSDKPLTLYPNGDPTTATHSEMLDYIKLQILKNGPFVYSSLEESKKGSKRNALHYVSDEYVESKDKSKEINKKREVTAYLYQAKEQVSKDIIYLISEEDYSEATFDEATVRIDNFMSENKSFEMLVKLIADIKKYGDNYTPITATIKKSKKNNIIFTAENGKLMFNGNAVGESILESFIYFNKNQKEYLELKTQLFNKLNQ